MSTPSCIIVFDLDGTLLQGNSFHLWLRFWGIRSLCKSPLRTLQLAFWAAARGLRLIPHSTLKLQALKLSRDASEQDIQAFCQQLVRRLHPEVRDALEQARRTPGTLLCLNTAAPALYVEAFAQNLGIPHVFATSIPKARNPWLENLGEHKVTAMQAIWPELESIGLAAVYSDESADLPLMRLARAVYLVEPRADDYKRVSEAIPGVSLIGKVRE